MARTAATATGVGAEAPTAVAATVVAMMVAVAATAATAAGREEEVMAEEVMAERGAGFATPARTHLQRCLAHGDTTLREGLARFARLRAQRLSEAGARLAGKLAAPDVRKLVADRVRVVHVVRRARVED